MIAAICVIPAQCRPMPWAMGPTDTSICIDQYGVHMGLRVVDILTDVALAVLPGILFMKLQMHRSKRLLVALLFGLRIVYEMPVLVLTSRWLIRSQDSHFHSVRNRLATRLLRRAHR